MPNGKDYTKIDWNDFIVFWSLLQLIISGSKQFTCWTCRYFSTVEELIIIIIIIVINCCAAVHYY
jgi:hypothetical protein